MIRLNQATLKLLLLTSSLALLSGCEESSPPTKSWELAVKGLYSGSLSNDGRLSAIGSISHGGSLWRNLENERRFSWNHQQQGYSDIIATGFSPEGNFALTADHQTMVLWDTRSGSSLSFWTAPSEVLALDLTPNGNYALLGLGDYSAVIFDVKRGGVKRTFYHDDRVRSVALSRDGKLAVTGSEDETARLWQVETGKQLFSWPHADEVLTVAITPKGDRALSVGKYDRVAVWNTSDGSLHWELPLRQTAIKRGQAFTAAEFSEDGQLLLTGNSDRTVELWDVTKKQRLARWTVPKRDPWKPTGATILSLAFSEQANRYFALASNGFSHQLER